MAGRSPALALSVPLSGGAASGRQWHSGSKSCVAACGKTPGCGSAKGPAAGCGGSKCLVGTQGLGTKEWLPACPHLCPYPQPDPEGTRRTCAVRAREARDWSWVWRAACNIFWLVAPGASATSRVFSLSNRSAHVEGKGNG